MNTDRHALALRLESLDEEELQALYGKLNLITTGSKPPEGVDFDRTLHVIETTNCKRGALLNRLLGDVNLGLENLRVSPTNFQPMRQLSYRSDHEAEAPRYYASCSTLITSAEVEQLLQQESEPLLIEGSFPLLPSGWTAVSSPPLSPRMAIPAKQISSEGFWILVCQDPEAAKKLVLSLADHESTSRPLLIALEETDSVAPQSLDGIRCCPIEEAPEYLTNFFARFETISQPDKRSLVRAIGNLHASAQTLIQSKQAETRIKESLKLTLDIAESEWEKMFLDEKREAVRDIRLDTVSHQFLKSRLVFSSEREAKVAAYLRGQLAPRIQNFVKRQALELAKVKLHDPQRSQNPKTSGQNEDWSSFRAGVLMAIPSLALLSPTLVFEPSKAAAGFQTDETDIAATDSPGLDSEAGLEDGEWLSGIEGAIFARLSPFLEKTKNWLGELLQDQFSGIEKQLGEIDHRLGQLLGIMIAGQVAMAVAAVFATIIVIKGSLSLSDTEERILNLINQLQDEWDGIRKSLEALVPELEGETSPELLRRSQKVIKELETL